MGALHSGPDATVFHRNRRASWRAAWICGYTCLFFGGLVLATGDGVSPDFLGPVFVGIGGLLMCGGLLVPFHNSRLMAVGWRGVCFQVGPRGNRRALIPWEHIEAAGVGWRLIRRAAHRPSRLHMFYLRMRVPPSDSLLSSHVRWNLELGEIQLLHAPKAGLAPVMRAIRKLRGDLPLEGDVAEPTPVRRAARFALFATIDTALIAFTASIALLLVSHGPRHAAAFIADLKRGESHEFAAVEAHFYRHFPLTLSEQIARLRPGGEEDWLASYERGQRVWRDETRPGVERLAVAERAFVGALDRLTPTLAFRHLSVSLLREIFDSADSVMRSQGRWQEVEALTRRRLLLFRSLLGEDRLVTGAAHEALGNILQRRGDFRAAQVEFAEALRVYRLRGRRSSVEKLQRKLAAAR